MSAPRLICLGNVVVDVVLAVPRLPERGGDVLASAARVAAGGAFNVMAAAVRQGMAVVYAGATGTGPLAALAADALAAEGIEAPVPPRRGRDTGFVVCAVEPGGERTFLTSPGAETSLTERDLANVTAAPGDVVFLSGYGLLHPANRAALLGWLARMDAEAMLAVDPGPLVADTPASALEQALARADWLTCNEREARIMTGERDPAAAASALAKRPAAGAKRGTAREDRAATPPEQGGTRWGRAGAAAGIVVRAGAAGCWLARAEGDPAHVPAFAVRAVDTTGAGDTHTGVFLAALAQRADAGAAARRANAAAALSVTRSGPGAAPSRAELEAFLAGR